MKTCETRLTFLARPLAALLLIATPLLLRAADTAVISGSVSNTATGNLLQGARVTVPALNRSALTDDTGRFVLTDLPAGTHEVVVSYIGLDPVRAQVSVAEGGRAEQNFDLTTGIYKMGAFKVTGEREGDAAALTTQRNAENLKNVVAMDSFGNLPNMSVGEVVMRLPGMAGTPTDEGLNYGFNTRGTGAALNTVTVDGQLMPSLGTNRAFELQSITGTMFEALELTKGHRPDQNADSLGGTLNLKTRSPLSMREKRRVTYSFTTRWAPPFLEQIPIRERHRAHPLATVAYQELFDIFGGQRNLAISANTFYSENAVGYTSTTLDYQNTLAPTAYIWDYRIRDNFNNRKQSSLNLRTDYRWSPTTRFSVTLLGNNNFERFRRRMEVRATTGSATSAPAIAAAASNDHLTVVNPSTANNLDVSIDGPRNYYVRTRRLDFSGDHEYQRWTIDYTGGWGYTHLNNGDGTAGSLTMRLGTISPTGTWSAGGAGWIIDRTNSDFFPSFRQNGGPDFRDGNNYRPTGNFSNGNTQNDQRLTQFRFNARYQVPLPMPTYLKAGLSYRSQVLDIWAKDQHRWTYTGTGPLPTYPDFPTYHARETGVVFPRWYSNDFMDKRRPKDLSLWREDLYYYESQKYSGTRGLQEVAQAAYVMAQGRLGTEGFLGHTGYLGGVRVEDTTVDSWGWVAARVQTTTAQRNADPAGAARQDYESTFRTLHGDYRKPYPSIHTWHDVTPNLKVRASYSTSFGRAALSNFLPSESYDDINKRVTVANPGILPQQAKTWDLSTEYYFEPVGQLSVGWFHKTIRDFIINNQEIRTIPGGADNGYNGQYEGWTEYSSLNAGQAIAEGWEFAYRQQFTFLPGPLKGLAGSFNYTWIDGHGPLAGTTYLNKHELAGFIPYVANASLSWRYRKFSTRVLYNFTGEYIDTYNANQALRLYRKSFKTVNVGVAYQLRPSISLSLDVANIFNEPQILYRGFKGRTQFTLYNFVTITGGINGRF